MHEYGRVNHNARVKSRGLYNKLQNNDRNSMNFVTRKVLSNEDLLKKQDDCGNQTVHYRWWRPLTVAVNHRDIQRSIESSNRKLKRTCDNQYY